MLLLLLAVPFLAQIYSCQPVLRPIQCDRENQDEPMQVDENPVANVEQEGHHIWSLHTPDTPPEHLHESGSHEVMQLEPAQAQNDLDLRGNGDPSNANPPDNIYDDESQADSSPADIEYDHHNGPLLEMPGEVQDEDIFDELLDQVPDFQLDPNPANIGPHHNDQLLHAPINAQIDLIWGNIGEDDIDYTWAQIDREE